MIDYRWKFVGMVRPAREHDADLEPAHPAKASAQACGDLGPRDAVRGRGRNGLQAWS